METCNHEYVEELSLIYAALGEEARLSIVIYLLDHPSNVNDIAEKLQMSQPKVSHHLRILKDARILKAKKDGKNIVYELVDEHVKNIVLLGISHMGC